MGELVKKYLQHIQNFELRSCLGVFVQQKKYIKDYSIIVGPLTQNLNDDIHSVSPLILYSDADKNVVYSKYRLNAAGTEMFWLGEIKLVDLNIFVFRMSAMAHSLQLREYRRCFKAYIKFGIPIHAIYVIVRGDETIKGNEKKFLLTYSQLFS